jgi:hypothetical protein
MKTNNYIKTVKPRKNSKYHQGLINPATLHKYYKGCSDDPIIYRSGLELQFIEYCENSAMVAKWASEPIKIPYYNHLLQKQQNYYPDYIIENDKGVRCIVEVKPYNQTIKPDATDSVWLKEAWIVNLDKWKAAKAYADANDMKFIIITEKFFE